jgi:hypothetical protein
MLFFPVYTEAHPRQNAAHAASGISSNPFHSYSFRTLASHFQTSVSSNLFEIKRFRTLCRIPGIGYPSRLALFAIPVSFSYIETLCFQTLTHSFAQWRSCNSFPFNHLRTLSIAMGVYTPYLYSPLRLAAHERTNCALLRNKSYACHTCAFHGGRGGYTTFSLRASLLHFTPLPLHSVGSILKVKQP